MMNRILSEFITALLALFPIAIRTFPPKSPPLLREHRLYQTDWLIRLYGFNIHEVLPPEHNTLDLDKDPKLAWALRNRHLFPVDVNVAPKEMLLRVPGLGATMVNRILNSRRHRKIRTADLATSPSMARAKFFLTTFDDVTSASLIDSLKLENRVLANKETQLDLFSSITGNI